MTMAAFPRPIISVLLLFAFTLHGSLCDLSYSPIPLSQLVAPQLADPDPVSLSRTNTKEQSTKSLEDYLLPDDLIPLEYTVVILPFLTEGNFTFEGEVKIDIIPIRNTRTIRLHAYDIEIVEDGITVSRVGNPPGAVPVSSWALDTTDTQFLTIHLTEQLTVGQLYELKIFYVGQLNNQLDGFYRSSYKAVDNSTRWLAVTQFETTGARRAFPCWDEPRFKARFNIELGFDAPSGYHAVSNTPAKNTSDLPQPAGWKSTKFERTVMMSPYLVAFLVSDFTAYPNTSVNYVDYARPAFSAYLETSNNLSKPFLDYMSDYTGHVYEDTNPKLDQVAVPDFAAGAMENWGLVTYREAALLYDPANSPMSTKFGVASIVAHELAHQWFGNLVTCKWWSHIWLNEGFATYFSYEIVQNHNAAWKFDEMRIFEAQAAFSVDSLETSKPILRSEVASPEELGSVFDTIAYSKGSCMVRMLHHVIMGEAKFKKAINEYLTDRKLNVAGKDDLWSAMHREAVAEPPLNIPATTSLAEIMDSWVVQPGYPVVTFTRNYANNSATVTQTRFLTLPSITERTEVYWVPLTHITNVSAAASGITWLSGEDLYYPGLPTDAENKWVLVNPNQAAYYRVNYDEKNWGLLTTALNDDNFGLIPVMSRAQLMDDAFALARAGLLSYDIALETTSYIDTERDYVPLASGLGALSYLRDRLAAVKEERELFEFYGVNKTIPYFEELGGVVVWANDTELTLARTRPLVLGWTCRFNEPSCNNQSSDIFKKWMAETNPEPVDKDLKSVVYCSAMRIGGDAEYDFLLEEYNNVKESKPSETSLILNALGCSNDVARLEKLLEESIKEVDPAIRPQDARTVLTAVYNNPVGVDLALDFVLGNYERCKEVYGGLGAMGRVFSGISSKLNTIEHKQKLEDFKAENEDLGSVESSVDAAIKTVEDNIAWHDAHHDTVVGYFRNFKGSAASVSAFSALALMAIAALLFGAK